MAQVLQGGDFAAAAHNPVVGSSSATSADRDVPFEATWGYLTVPPGRYVKNPFPPKGHFGALPCGGVALGRRHLPPTPYNYPRGVVPPTPLYRGGR